MTALLAFFVVVVVVFILRIRQGGPRIFPGDIRVGLVVAVCLIAFVGYFRWREHATIGELARLVEPVPQITSVTYVPDRAEVLALARALAAAPGSGILTTTRADRQAMARAVEDYRSQFWLFRTALSPDQVIAFYADAAHRPGWELTFQNDAWTMLEGGDGRLIIYAGDDWPRPGTRVLYVFDAAHPPG